jgi:hypothetical protein
MGIRGMASLRCARHGEARRGGECLGCAAKMTGFQESDPGVEGWRVEAFQTATSGARVGKASSLGVARDPSGVAPG